MRSPSSVTVPLALAKPVIATMALGLAARGSLVEAARLANRAAGLAVARFGPVAISYDELTASLAQA